MKAIVNPTRTPAVAARSTDRLKITGRDTLPSVDHMTFTIGDRSYELQMVADPPVCDEQEVYAVINREAGEISIHSALQGMMRLETLLHELWHGVEWDTHPDFGDVEARCDFFGNWSAHFYNELQAQGGLAALLAMEPTQPTDEPLAVRQLRRELARAIQRAEQAEAALSRREGVIDVIA